MAVASLVLGIISIVLSFFGGINLIGGVLGIIGIILGKKNPEKKGLATAGFICSIIGTILCLLLYVVGIIFIIVYH